MGASTRWYVQVFRIFEDTVEVSAVTSEEAREEASLKDGVIHTGGVYHWSEFEDDPSI